MDQVPPGRYKYEGRVVFVSYPRRVEDENNWHIWGPEKDIEEGAVVDVYVYTENTTRPVEVIEIVADREVRRHDGTRVRYVMATFDFIEQDWRNEKPYPEVGVDV
jgi:hypothetical protein